MDPLFAASTLSSASRQVTDPSWPARDIDREMTIWSSAPEPRGGVSALTRISFAIISRMRAGLARLAPASGI